MDQQDLDECPVEDRDQPFAITSADSANWAVRKIVAARQYAERVERWAAAEIRRAQQEEEWFLTRYGGQLQEWVADEVKVRGGRSRSINLPAGRVGFRQTPSSIRVIDERALVGWCQQHLPEGYRLRIDVRGRTACLLAQQLPHSADDLSRQNEVLVREVEKYIASTGEIPPGAMLTEPADRFYVK